MIVNLDLVRQGLAWRYDKYRNRDPPGSAERRKKGKVWLVERSLARAAVGVAGTGKGWVSNAVGR